MLKKLGRIALHVLACLLIYLVPFLVTYGRIDFTTLFREMGGTLHACSTLLLFGYAYLNHYVLVPRLFLQRRYWLYGALVLAGMFAVLQLPHLLAGGPHQLGEPGEPGHGHGLAHGPGGPHGPHNQHSLISPLTYNLVLFVICTFASISIRQQRRLMNVQREKLQAELSFLKAQINPHFLFNTLNSIYALAITKSDDTPRAITQLADLMRYILKDSESEQVPLDKELGYIGNYVALQRRRLGNTVRIDYQAPSSFQSRSIAPLILVSFVENAFKHGINPAEDSAIAIEVRLQEQRLDFRVRNNKVSSGYHEERMGIGLSNARARLQHFYPGRHHLQIDDNEHDFSVHLILDLHD